MYDANRVLMLMAGYAKKVSDWQGETPSENWAAFPNLLLDEWHDAGYRLSASWGELTRENAAKSRLYRDELISMALPAGVVMDANGSLKFPTVGG